MKQIIVALGIIAVLGLLSEVPDNPKFGETRIVNPDPNTIVFDGSDPAAMPALVVGGVLALAIGYAVWGARPPAGHSNWAGTSFGNAMLAAFVLAACVGMLVYLAGTEQDGGLARALAALWREP